VVVVSVFSFAGFMNSYHYSRHPRSNWRSTFLETLLASVQYAGKEAAQTLGPRIAVGSIL
jgi:hypothetical protein